MAEVDVPVKTTTRTSRDWFGPDVPSSNLPFPPSAKITAVELLTFLPLSLKCPSVVYRLASNGATRGLIWTIINTHRNFEVHWPGDNVGRMVQGAMRAAGYEDWTFGIHKQYRPEAENWDKNDISVAEFKLPCESGQKGSVAPAIPFSQLAWDVRRFPEGDDGLDLTRMARYAKQHPEEGFMYPDHYSELLETVGGPAVVSAEHTDEAAFGRWQNAANVPPPAEPRQQRLHRPSSPIPGRKRTQATQAERNAGGTKRVRTQEARRESTVEGDMPQSHDCEMYVRAPPKFVHPLRSSQHPPPSEEELHRLFLAQRGPLSSATTAYSPYAFNGPRILPPYRSLHRIDQPAPNDASGWAENLRWAKEQVDNFPSDRIPQWNESPEHMEAIVEHRKNQNWASDEWLWHYISEQELREIQRREAMERGIPSRVPKEEIQLQPVPQPAPGEWADRYRELGIRPPSPPLDRLFEEASSYLDIAPICPKDDEGERKRDRVGGEFRLAGAIFLLRPEGDDNRYEYLAE